MGNTNPCEEDFFYVFDFFGYFAIPFLAAALARETDLFATNFSSIRTASHRQGEFLLWSLSLLVYLFLCILSVLPPSGSGRRPGANGFFRKKQPFPVVFFFLFPAVLLLTAVFTPYLPEEEPFWSQVHVYTCVWSSVSFFILLALSVLPVYFSCLVQAGRKSAPVPSHLKRRLLRSFLPDHRDCQQRHGDFLYLCLLRLRKPLKAVFLPPCFEKNHIKKARLKLFCPDVPFPATIFSAFITGFCTPQSLRRLLHNKRRSPLALHTR